MLPTTTRFDRSSKCFDLLVVLLFGGGLLAPQIDHWVREDSERDCRVENRRPAGRPSLRLDWNELRTFATRYETYWNDTFGLRDVLLRWHSLVKIVGFGVSPTPDYEFGIEAPWLFNAGNHVMENFRGLHPMSEVELEEWRVALEAHRDAASKVGAKYAFVLAPEKHEIYPEWLSKEHDRVGVTRRQQFIEWMARRSNVLVIDTTEALRAARGADTPNDRVYFESGTHWEGRGAWAAAREIERALEPILPGLADRSTPLLELVKVPDLHAENDTVRMYVGDLWPERDPTALLLRDAASFRSTRIATNPVQVEITRRDAVGPRVVVFHDSFGEALQHWLAASFGFTRMLWTPAFDSTVVARDRPDIVLEIFVERVFLTNRPDRVAAHDDPTLEVAFRTLGRPVFALDVAASRPQIQPFFEARVTTESDPNGLGLTLTTTRVTDTFGMPEIDATSSSEWWVAAIEIESKTETYFEIMVPRNGLGYLPANVLSVPLEPGANRRFVAIDPRGIDGRLVIRPGRVPGDYRLRRFEIREVVVPK